MNNMAVAQGHSELYRALTFHSFESQPVRPVQGFTKCSREGQALHSSDAMRQVGVLAPYVHRL